MAKALREGHESVGYARLYMQQHLSSEEMARIDSQAFRDSYCRLYEACPKMAERIIRQVDTRLFDEWEATGFKSIEQGDRPLTASGELVEEDEKTADEAMSN